MVTVSFDESGNTGADLTNEVQPVFVLASCDLTHTESDELLKSVSTHNMTEAKFSTLRKSASGRKRILGFVNEASSYEGRIKTTIFHKRYMVITKIVDIIIETMAHTDGIDLYKDGANIAMSNMHYYCLDKFCGKERTNNMFESFVNMIRNQDQFSMGTFYYHAWQIYAASINRDYQKSIAPILASESAILKILENIDSNSLDPAIPAFFNHCAVWGDLIGDNFDVLHDNSKPLFQEKEILELFMSKEIPYKEIGYDRRKYTFPLRANGVCFGDSKHDSRLQIVDLVAGCTCLWAKGLNNPDLRDDFWGKLNDVDIKKFAINVLWPSPDVTPVELGADGGGGINAVDYMAEQLWNLTN